MIGSNTERSARFIYVCSANIEYGGGCKDIAVRQISLVAGCCARRVAAARSDSISFPVQDRAAGYCAGQLSLPAFFAPVDA